MNIKELNFEVEKLEKKLEETRKNMDSNLKKIYLAKKEGGKGFKTDELELLMNSIKADEKEIKNIQSSIEKNKEDLKENLKEEKKGVKTKMGNLVQEFRAGNLVTDELTEKEIKILEKDLFLRSFKAVVTGDREAISDYENFRATNMNEGTMGKNNGGLVVPTIMYDKIFSKVLETSVLLEKVDVSHVPGNLKLIYDSSDIVFQWAGDNKTRDLTETPIFSSKTLEPKLGTVRVEISKLLLATTEFDLEGYITEKVSKKFALEFDNAIANGTGSGQPMGIITALNNKKYEIDESYTEIVKMIRTALGSPYHQNSMLCMNRNTLAKFDSITDTSGRPIFQITGYKDTFEGYILGVPVVTTSVIPENTIIYGDLAAGYHFNISLDMNITSYDKALVGEYTNGYLFATAADGNVIDENSIALIEFKKKVITT